MGKQAQAARTKVWLRCHSWKHVLKNPSTLQQNPWHPARSSNHVHHVGGVGARRLQQGLHQNACELEQPIQ
jgi:hypothetical protein